MKKDSTHQKNKHKTLFTRTDMVPCTKMEQLYGRGYELLKQLGYNGKGCGNNEQGICVPIKPNTQETKTILGYSFSKTTN